jgi:hypothetical protein
MSDAAIDKSKGEAANSLEKGNGDLREDLRRELLRRGEADKAARTAAADGGQEALRRVQMIDDENAAWLQGVIETVGWPGRSGFGEEGADAAWLLAQHADRRPSLQRRCLKLLEQAVAAGEAPARHLAYLTDRVLLASGGLQIYGTQMKALDGRFVTCRLRDPETVDARRASIGLETLQASLDRALRSYGPPTPARMPCPTCGEEIEVWLPELGGRVTVRCPACRSAATIRPKL